MNGIHNLYKAETGFKATVEIEQHAVEMWTGQKFQAIAVGSLPAVYQQSDPDLDIIIPSSQYVSWMEEKIEHLLKSVK
jgi:hypothetical protein